jgi:uncharacterized membrane protein
MPDEPLDSFDQAEPPSIELTDPHVEQAIEQLFESGAPPDRKKLARFLMMYHEGPMPSPRALAEYGSVVPDLPERISGMAEKEQDFRHEMGRADRDIQRLSLTENARYSARALNIGGGLLGALFSMGFVLTVMGHDHVAEIIFGTCVLAIVGAFITRQIPRSSSSATSESGRP